MLWDTDITVQFFRGSTFMTYKMGKLEKFLEICFQL